MIIAIWAISALLSFGIAGLYYTWMVKSAGKPWSLKLDKSYAPNVTIIIPTYNEADLIRHKLRNIMKIRYPKSLLQFIIVDSNSEDETRHIATDFANEHPDLDILQLYLTERGKNLALNHALKHAKGEVIVISDADCFYHSDILENSLYYLSDPRVGAISGPKILMNLESSNTVRTEKKYLDLMNKVKLGESKMGFTTLFEGGFSAYKIKALSSFDPYQTGSDDCGTVLNLAEKAYITLLIPEAAFFTAFPTNRRERLQIKIRRGNQLIRVFSKYFFLLLRNRIKVTKKVVVANTFIFLISPVFFFLFILLTAFSLYNYPYLALLLLTLAIPKIGSLAIEVTQNYFTLLCSLIGVAIGKNFQVWNQPTDRTWIKDELLKKYNLD